MRTALRSLSLLLVVTHAGACAAPRDSDGTLASEGPAPTDLSGLSRYLYRAHPAPDDEVPAAALVNLETWLDTFGDEGNGVRRGGPLPGRSWTIDALEQNDVAGLRARPDRPLENLIASSVAYVSDQPIACHAAVQVMPNQRPIEPTASSYTRTFPEQADPECFVRGDCATLSTRNDAVRSTVIFEAAFVLFKDFRWLSYEKDGAPRRAFYSRGWFEESYDGADGSGGNQLWQSYSLDVWIDRGTDVLRYQALWSETELYIAGIRVDDDSQLATVSATTDGIFSTTDQFIRKTLVPEGHCAP